jgi:hypothetical protein
MGCCPALRSFRIAAVMFFGLACALVIMLWARSYSGEDRASGHYSKSTGVRLYSSRGWLVCSKNTNQNYPWDLDLGSDYWLRPGDSRLQFSIPSDFVRGAAFSSISIPHSYLLVACAAISVIAWPRKSYRFSLRSLLIAMTLIAVGLGLIAGFQAK